MATRRHAALTALVVGTLLLGAVGPSMAAGDRRDPVGWQNQPSPGRAFPAPPPPRPQFTRPHHGGNQWQRQQYVEQYYRSHPHDADYRAWRHNRNRWGDNDYQRWYRDRHDDNNDAAIAALFGLAAGALIGGALAQPSAPPPAPAYAPAGAYPQGSQDWLNYCSQRYRSFDPVSGTYMGYDGQRHPCR